MGAGGPALPHWVALEALPDEPDRFGHKAVALARAAREGLPVLPGWVLPHGELPVDRERSRELAAALAALAPGTDRWILRSSSPLEDRPGRSAAGLFDSPLATGEEGVADALLAHERRRHDPALARGLDRPPPLPLAVLAQPAREFSAWCTAESGPRGMRLEGRPGAVPPVLQQLARRAAPGPGWILELGLDPDGAWLLQRRPAPAGSPPAPLPGAGAAPDPLPPPPPGEFEPDHEHAPLPLCPLLATGFVPWLLRQGEDAGSWLVEGRWHDRRRPGRPRLDARGAQDVLRRWKSADAPALRTRLRQLERALHEGPMDAARWARWQGQWLQGQELYFAAARGAARRWAMAQRDPGALPETVAGRRRRGLARLARELPDPAAPADAGERRALGRFLARHGHHAALPWDGRAVAWWEEPRRLRPWLAAARAAGTNAAPGESPAGLPARVLAMCEDDDDLLARLYALWRLAALRAGRAIGLETASDVLDLCRDDLDALLERPDPGRLAGARERGRALAARWEAATPTGDGTAGVPASAGRASGPPECRRGALDGGPPPPGCVLVVPSLSPPDALALGGVAAVVCEGGDALGHAALLTREAGIPCVVRVPGARAALGGHAELLVDGDRGRVLPQRA